MDIRFLRSFVILADTGNYGDAAKKLCMTQPALTKQILSLENEFGLSLFMRGRHGAQLTQEGHQLLAKSREIIEKSAELHHLAADVAKGKTGILKLGFGLSGIKIAPRLIASFRQAYPDVVISLEDMSSSMQAEELLHERLQLAFMRMPVAAPLMGKVLHTESIVLAVMHDDLPSMTGKIQASQNYQFLSEYPFLSLNPESGPGLNQQISHFFATHKILPATIQEARDIQTLLALVAAGIGVAIVPESAIHIAPEEIAMIPLVGPYSTWDVGLVWNATSQNPIRDLFIAQIATGQLG
jgi:DNA-binding transcriptional LysR family regulator